jgi:hypothetical protein
MSTAYHPQTDGQTERVNQVLEGYLRIFTSRRQDDWDDFLPTGEFQYNNMVHSSTQQTPFMVDTRRHPCMGFEPQQPWSTLESANKFAERIALGIEEAKVALTKAKDEHAMFYNRQREPAPVYAPGDIALAMAHTALNSLTISAAFTPSSPWSSCPPCLLIPSLADDQRRPHPQLLSMARRSMRSRQYWIAECVTTDWSTYSSSRVMTKVTINGRFTHKSMQS